jgi:hypothetical protein
MTRLRTPDFYEQLSSQIDARNSMRTGRTPSANVILIAVAMLSRLMSAIYARTRLT